MIIIKIRRIVCIIVTTLLVYELWQCTKDTVKSLKNAANGVANFDFDKKDKKFSFSDF